MMKKSRLTFTTLLLFSGLTLFFSKPALSEELSFIGVSGVQMSIGNNPLNATTVASGYSISAAPECGITFTITQTGGTLNIEKNGADQICTIELMIPAGLSSIQLETGNGDFSFQGQAQQLTLNGGNGAIDVANSILDVLDLNSSNGDITVSSCQASFFKLVSANGAIKLLRSTGRFRINGSNSEIRVKQVTLPAKSFSIIRDVNGLVDVSGLKTAKVGRTRAGLLLTTDSTNGTVSVNGRSLPSPRLTVLHAGKKPAHLSIRTTNASIIVSNSH